MKKIILFISLFSFCVFSQEIKVEGKPKAEVQTKSTKTKEEKKQSFAKKYQAELEEKLKKLSSSEKISLLLATRLKDYHSNIGSFDLIKKELVQFYGKRQRNFIYSLLDRIKGAKVPKVKQDGNTILIETHKGVLRMKVTSFVRQKFAINGTLLIGLRDFDSLSDFLDFMLPKLEVILNSSYRFSLFPQAYADTNDTLIIAMVLNLVMINIYHGRSDACYETAEVYTDEFKDLTERCNQEDRNFNPSNIENIKAIGKEWEDLQSLFQISLNDPKPCKKVGQYFEYENSINCGFDKSFNDKHAGCKELAKTYACYLSLKAKADEFL